MEHIAVSHIIYCSYMEILRVDNPKPKINLWYEVESDIEEEQQERWISMERRDS